MPWLAKGFHTPRARLAFKLALCLVAGTTAFFAIFGYLSLRLQQRELERQVLQSADRISDVIQRSARHAMLRNDRGDIYELIRDIGSEPGIRRIRIFNEQGKISFSTDPREVNTVVDKQTEACYVCHSESAPLTKLDRPDRARIFRDASGRRVLGLILPIENQPSCWGSPCHAHREDRRILGVLDTDLSLEAVDHQLALQREQVLGFTAAAVLLASLLSVTFVWVFVHKPVRDLIAGTQRVASGDLDHHLPVRSKDELGELASSFNTMTADLERARAEITNWALTLEQRVEEKAQELKRAQTNLVASEKMASLGKLAATVAHEVNNPLFGILTYVRLILKELQKPDVAPHAKEAMIEQLRIVERESHRCGEIVRNLLSFSRQAPSHRKPEDINTLVRRALTLVGHQLELSDIALETNLVDGLPAVLCDSGQVQQVMLALLVNAMDAMPQGGQLRVSTEQDAGGSTVRVRILDNGSGIPPDVLSNIFDPFFTTKEDQLRTGLGLAIARGILEQHGGAIVAHSTPEDGTEFVISFPVESPVAADLQKKEDTA